MLAEGVDGEHVRVIDQRHGAGLLHETLPPLITEGRGVHEFDGHPSVQVQVEGGEHDAHRPAPELAQDPVGTAHHIADRG